MFEAIVPIVALLSVVGILVKAWYGRSRWARNIPVLSSDSGIFSTWEDMTRYVKNSPKVLSEGYEKYSKRGLFFQIPTPNRWFIVVPPHFIDEIRKAPEEFLSGQEAANDVQQAAHTISPIVQANKFHFGIIKSALTPALDYKIDDIRDEIQLAFRDEIGLSTDWKAFPMSMMAHRIATRTANRLLVGEPLCRNEEYLQMSIRYTIDVFGGADKLRAYPNFLRTFMSRFVTNVAQQQSIARKHLIPYIKTRLAEEERFKRSEKSQEWEKVKPSDSLQWVIDAAPNELERMPERLVYRLLHINVAAVHTTSVTFLNCMFDLSLHPEVHDELRHEITENVAKHGWTKQTLQSLKKLDSFMLESQRLSPIASSQMTRKVMQDFTFPNGTTVPAGSWVLAPMYPMCNDDQIFANAEVFDPFRFSRLREEPGEENRHQFVSTSTTHINFGHGKHACPGRFFASNEIKLLLAFVLLKYDIKYTENQGPPLPTWYDRSRRPNQLAKVSFRCRGSVGNEDDW